ncbi:MAG: acyltransferase [Arenimonas sp.]
MNENVLMSNIVPLNPALHGLRGFAAMWVLMFHWSFFFPAINNWLVTMSFGPKIWMNLSLPLAVGGQGVSLFFVLSAYLLTTQWLHRPLTSETIAKFWKRRFLRIYPAVWFQLILLIAISNFFYPVIKSISLWEFIRNASLWIYLPPTMSEPINGVWWTLPIELMFYLVLPLLIFLQHRWNWKLVVLLCLLTTLLWRLGVRWYYPGRDLSQVLFVLSALPGVLFTFAAGFALAFIPISVQKNKLAYWLIFLSAAYFLLEYAQWENLATYWRGSALLMVWEIWLAVLVAIAVYLVLGWPYKLNIFKHPLMIWCGNLSFGIYLWHYPVLQFSHEHWPPDWGWGRAGSIVALALCLAITFGLAAISYYAIERPLMGWAKKGEALAR